MGCVYYFVLSNGDHLFGDAIKRQANILSHEFDMEKLISKADKPYECILARELIADMIKKDPSERPSADAVLKHPMFWREEKILAFLQDVSDRIEKLDLYTEPLKSLERNAKFIIRDDWSLHLDEGITEDLKKYRGYHSISVRDLLRALRNKVWTNYEVVMPLFNNIFSLQKHHYHELSYDVQKVLGTIPCDFVRYWIKRFPHLLSHAYHAMQSCSREPLFKRYFPLHNFTKPDYFDDPDKDNFELQEIVECSRLMYNGSKSPKKESRQPTNGLNKTEKSKRGSYNFIPNQNPNGSPGNGAFITRDQMQKTDKRRKKSIEEKNVVWMLPK